MDVKHNKQHQETMDNIMEIYFGYDPAWILAHSPGYWVQELMDEGVVPTVNNLFQNCNEEVDYASEEEIDVYLRPELYVLITPKWKRAPLLSFEYQLRQAQRKDTVQLLFKLFIEILKLCTGSNIQEADIRPLS